jgi:glucose-6-phosphate isomerase
LTDTAKQALEAQGSAGANAAHIRLDIAGMMREVVGENGFTLEDLRAPLFAKAAQRMRDKRATMAFRDLPFTPDAVVEGVLHQAARIRERFDAFVVFGIGGSALGPMAVHQALNHLRYNELPDDRRNGPRLYVEDNVDPARMHSLLDVIDIGRTCFNVISKSGQTSETMVQLLIIADLLNRRGLPLGEHIVVTTDERSGNLIKIAKQFGLPTLHIPDGVGGRFSELTPVGLLAAAVCGIDIRALLAGAALMERRAHADDVMQNIAYLDGALQYLCMQRGINVSVMMPYADSLKLVSDWYAQLWAESLGKEYDLEGNVVNVGQTPAKALGVTDQHSQVQLYTQGPFDKVVTFLRVESYGEDFPIPHGFDDTPDVAFLGGHSLEGLIKAEQFATAYALTRAKRLHKSIVLPEVSAFTLGQLLQMLEIETAFVGELLNINAFDQPGVEEGKDATYALLGKAGYEQKRAALEASRAKGSAYLF